MPEWSQFGLTSNVPDVELKSFVVNLLDIETNSGHRWDCLVEFHLVEDRGFSCIVKSQHENLGFKVGEWVEESVDELSHMWLDFVNDYEEEQNESD